MSPNILDEELCRWKTNWQEVQQQDHPETISDTLKLPHFPTKLFGTIPSAHAHNYNYMRCTESEERPSALTIIHMNYEYDINSDHGCKFFFPTNGKAVYFIHNLI